MTTEKIRDLVATLAELRRERDRLASQGDGKFETVLEINDRIRRVKAQQNEGA